MTARYAIYAAPGSGAADAPVARALLERAEAWLGRATDGRDVPARADTSLQAVDAMTVDARRYGFHGTLKAPFRLAEGTDAAELDAAVAAFAATRPAVVVPHLALTRIGHFLALTPGVRADDLHALADDVVTTLDRFRAPATEAETARRRPDRLPTRQRKLLERWGYPYVLDEFRFHLTLTDRVPHDRLDAVERTLRTWFADQLGRDLPVEALAVFVEPAPGEPFTLRSLHPLRPAPVEGPR